MTIEKTITGTNHTAAPAPLDSDAPRPSCELAKNAQQLRQDLAEKGKLFKLLENNGVTVENAEELQAKIQSAIGFLDDFLGSESSDTSKERKV